MVTSNISFQIYSFTEKAMAPHSSTLAWKIPWMEEPGRLQPWGCEESDTTERLHFHSVVSNSLQSRGLYSPWNSLDQNTRVGSLLLLQEIFPTQGWNSGLTQCRQILYPLSHKGKSKNTGVGSLSLLQWIFLTQELNWGLLHCRQIL